MPTSVLIVVALSVLLGFLVIALAPRDTEASGSTAADRHVHFPQVHWNVDHGSAAYLTMLDQLDQLRNLAEKAPRFADVVISGGNDTPTVHAVVRLRDFHVVRFLAGDTPHDFVLNLASGVPGAEDATDDNFFLGMESHDALARVANQSLTVVNLCQSSLEDSLRDLGVRGTDRTAQACGMLRYVIAITEASRFRPVADLIANGMDKGTRNGRSSPCS
ncbi:ribosome-inactivating family protein [Streptomyces muensis]|uniref:Ribosome-inactivating family protein n=1 Tax=Streptomyces muensis TaxID=1077944 RepID=A0A9X1Q770_STRM4|nr:ribosome-inactivating family protein [Streptomyces muensis]MCF1599174.1 ribosome-inactivating family protein [Streptomyces muensis]